MATQQYDNIINLRTLEVAQNMAAPLYEYVFKTDIQHQDGEYFHPETNTINTTKPTQRDYELGIGLIKDGLKVLLKNFLDSDDLKYRSMLGLITDDDRNFYQNFQSYLDEFDHLKADYDPPTGNFNIIWPDLPIVMPAQIS
jgi:hypothetical protein